MGAIAFLRGMWYNRFIEPNAVCRENGAILWQDICELKKQYPLSNETIVAYVLQEKLRFEMDPYFCITARKP